PKIAFNVVPGWMLYILLFQIGVAYFYGGIAKINPDWLQGQPMFLWLAKETNFPVIGPYFSEPWMVLGMSYAGLLLDLLIVPALVWKKTRKWAFILITAFHVMNHFLWNIGIFPWFMIAATTLYFEPDWFRKVLTRIKRIPLSFPKANTEVGSFALPTSLFVGICIFAAIQLVVPFRHWLSPGNVNWTEKGHRFSWHMKLRDKRARARFKVIDPIKNDTIKVDPRRYLTPRQLKKMRWQPDMVVQFAHHLGKKYKEKGRLGVQVYADIEASLNGRDLQQFIHPGVDLMTISHRSPTKLYVIPMETPLSLPYK
ncbi:MAG: HTTM domain-containing protein, partial [Saprospiraceae bacterium]|nr:HTTM domain-containing protein [Saprospiraceae bacterium]